MSFLARYGYAIALTIGSAAAVIIIQYLSNPWAFLIVLVTFLAAIVVSYMYFLHILHRSFIHTSLPAAALLAFIGLISVIEDSRVRIFLTLLCGATFFFIGSYALFKDNYPKFTQKPIRRVVMMIWVVCVYAILTSLFAINIFFPLLPYWIFAFAGALIVGGISFMVWRMYFRIQLLQLILWMLIMGFVMMEILWVMHLLPFGYLALGLLTTWIWYIMQLLLRFHFSPQGIVWRKQRGFLVLNALLFILLVIFGLRWV